MARGKSSNLVREVKPDFIYGSKIITKLINSVMQDGKRNVAATIVYGAIDDLQELITKLYNEENEGSSGVPNSQMVVYFVERAVGTIALYVELKTRRVGGANYRVPSQVKQVGTVIRRAVARIAKSARVRKEKSMRARLASELSDILNNAGESVKARDLVLRDIEANRAFAHLAR